MDIVSENSRTGELLVVLIFLFFLLFMIGYILKIIAAWGIFKKAGEKRWRALIPLYNSYTMYRITWRTSVFWVQLVLLAVIVLWVRSNNQLVVCLLYILMIAYNIIRAMSCYRLSRAFGHGMGYTAGLFFAEKLFGLIIGFGKSKYVGNTFILDVM